MVIVACFALNLFHPAITFKEGMTGLGGVGSGKKMRKEMNPREKDERAVSASGSGSTSEVEGVDNEVV